MPTPTLLATSVRDGQAPGVAYRIEGELTPVLHMALNGAVPVFFEHHVVLWKQPQLDITLHALKGAFKRVLSGMPVLLTQTEGAGEIAFSRDMPGHIIALHLNPGESIITREHQMVAATSTLDYTFERVKGFGSMMFGSQGFFQDRFYSTGQEGVVWLYGHGNIFEVTLAPGETIDVEPGSWIYRDESVNYEQKVFGLKTGLLGGGGNLVFNRLTGPGRVGLQSGYYAPGESATVAGTDSVAGQAAGAGLLGGLIGGAFNNS